MHHAQHALLMSLAGSALLLGACAGPGHDHNSAKRRHDTMILDQQQRPTGLFFASVTDTPGGRESRFAYYVPRIAHEQVTPLPMIVFLNGSGECGTDGVRQTTQGLLPAVLNKPEDWPFIIVFPQKPSSDSEWEDHASLVKACMDFVRARYSIDERRVYLTGLSQGGHGTWMIASMMPGAFAAIAPVCGYGPGGYGVEADPASLDKVAASLADTPVWAFHGDKDDVVPCAQTKSMIDAIRRRRESSASLAPADRQRLAADPLLRMTIYPDLNHGCWDRAYRVGTSTPDAPSESIAQWFLRFRRDAPTDR